MMNNNFSKTKSLRQKLLMIYHDDGILDIVVGVSILILAGVMGYDIPALIGLIGIPLTLYIPIKDSVSVPRIGFIKFEAEKATRNRLIILLLFGLIVLLILAFLGPIQNWLSAPFATMVRNNDILIFAGIMAGILFIGGQILKNSRFWIYSLLSLALVTVAYFFGFRVWIPVLVVGIAMEAVGLTKLINFLKKYPKNREM